MCAAAAFAYCAFYGLTSKSITLLQVFNACAFCCGAIALLIAILTFWIMITVSEECSSGKSFKNREGVCNGTDVRSSETTKSIVSGALSLLAIAAYCFGGVSSWYMLNQHKEFFSQSSAGSLAIAGNVTYVTAQAPGQITYGVPVAGSTFYDNGAANVVASAPPTWEAGSAEDKSFAHEQA